ncbi:hypothetical protein OMY_01406 [Enterococcus sulfureus ATCC 49903]|uniref:HTH cro/C1-type domain-containing protein n=1 Tax=Enterococcus sulfureus ATCC 49903 TaxID=1140003 RepID=S0NPY1_9ENTE|nr:helix-turn-helix transcriptional regulator [Enterococcus sulfureus]EOT47153.1 hypothetical protein OMY_01406 [Enterococcus sulfureus ATCC 49903]EOT83552.1 hypothetical protein I573_01274 [Enterococcus sulfureus ATCC 49903]
MNNVDKQAVGQRIKSLRTQKGLTMEKFGELFEPPASKSIVSRWERGKTLPSSDRIKKISEIYGISTYYILYGKKTFEDLYQDSSDLQNKIKEIDVDNPEASVELLSFLASSIENSNTEFILEKIATIDLNNLSSSKIQLLKMTLELIESDIDNEFIYSMNRFLRLIIEFTDYGKNVSPLDRKFLINELETLKDILI